ncbi:MAG: glycosyltransferase family 4 protein [Anaerolineales bacterium]|nr:glycosyltransferase family 4 protein [Anaerolineales bacterium]
MRIAYISLHWPRTRNSGVGKKIQSQIAAWNTMGHKARLFMHTSQHEPQSELIESDTFFYAANGKIKTEINRIKAMNRMIAAIRNFRPDLIYLRYGIYVYPAHLLMDIAPVVEEINTNDLTQHEELGGIYSLYNRLTRGIFLRNIRGLITVSRELAVSPAFASYRKPTRIIANGVDLKSFAQLPPASNEIPRLVFIGNPGCLWHGVDKLVTLAKLIPDVHLDIVGYSELPEHEPLPENITLHGYLAVQEYRNVLAYADVAISSLALHRVQLEEASPLKSRECLAFGLPLIVSYIDTDLDHLNFDFLLKIPNKEDNIQTHARAIRDFAWRMRGSRVDRNQVLRLDQANKEIDRIQFFSEILNPE